MVPHHLNRKRQGSRGVEKMVAVVVMMRWKKVVVISWWEILQGKIVEVLRKEINGDSDGVMVEGRSRR
jgi:hypothetical protein